MLTPDSRSAGGREHLYCIDGLKGICACIVAFLWHYQHFQPEGSPLYSVLKPFYDHGNLCVELFFLLSGFGMVLGYEKRILQGSVSGKEYYFRRIRKLFPIMILTAVVTGLLQIVYLHQTGIILQYPPEYFDAYHFLLNLFGMQYGILGTQFSFNGPAWFVAVLLACYVLLWLSLYFLKEKQEAVPFIYLILAVFGCALYVSGAGLPFLNDQMGRGIAGFFIGCLLARLYENRDTVNLKRVGYLCAGWIVLNGIISAIYGYAVLGELTMYTLLGLAPSVLLAVIGIPWLNALLGCRPLRKLGKMSVGIFFWHFPVQIVWKYISCFVPIRFSGIPFFMLYILSVFLTVVLYDLLIREHAENAYKLFLNHKEALH